MDAHLYNKVAERIPIDTALTNRSIKLSTEAYVGYYRHYTASDRKPLHHICSKFKLNRYTDLFSNLTSHKPLSNCYVPRRAGIIVDSNCRVLQSNTWITDLGNYDEQPVEIFPRNRSIIQKVDVLSEDSNKLILHVPIIHGIIRGAVIKDDGYQVTGLYGGNTILFKDLLETSEGSFKDLFMYLHQNKETLSLRYKEIGKLYQELLGLSNTISDQLAPLHDCISIPNDIHRFQSVLELTDLTDDNIGIQYN